MLGVIFPQSFQDRFGITIPICAYSTCIHEKHLKHTTGRVPTYMLHSAMALTMGIRRARRLIQTCDAPALLRADKRPGERVRMTSVRRRACTLFHRYQTSHSCVVERAGAQNPHR